MVIVDWKNLKSFDLGQSGALAQHLKEAENFIRIDSLMTGKPRLFGPDAHFGFVDGCLRDDGCTCTESHARAAFEFCQEAEWAIGIVDGTRYVIQESASG